MAVSYWDGKQWIDLASGQQGPPGPAGNGISSVVMNADYTLTINLTNGSSYTTPSIRGAQGEQGEEGPAGVGIASVALISGTHAPGTLDTYRITLTDGNTYDFQVYNGADGQGSPGSQTPKHLGTTGAVGTANAYAREDHVHPAFVELWRNPNPTASFAAQTVSLDLSSWDVVAIANKFNASSTSETIHIVRVGSQFIMNAVNFGSNAYVAKRTTTVSATGVTFAQGYRNTSGTAGAEYSVPVAVYGVVASVTGVLKTASGSVIAVSDALAKAVKSLDVDINAVQNLNGYDKPWAGGCGKNKFDVSKIVNTSDITINNGVISVTGNSKNSGKKLSELADLTVGETYILTANTTGTENIIYLYGTGANVSWTFGTSKTMTQDILDALVFFYGGRNTTSQISNFMIRLASVTDATYAPYSNICPISGWSNVNVYREAQYDAGATPYATINLNGTVYGGSLNVTTGVLTVTEANIASYAGETLPSTWISDRDVYAVGTTPTTGAQVVYELATPQTVQLSPTTVQMLLGNNTLWADSGDSEVQYWAVQ